MIDENSIGLKDQIDFKEEVEVVLPSEITDPPVKEDPENLSDQFEPSGNYFNSDSIESSQKTNLLDLGRSIMLRDSLLSGELNDSNNIVNSNQSTESRKPEFSGVGGSPEIIVVANSFGSKKPVYLVQVLCKLSSTIAEESTFETHYTNRDGKVRIGPLTRYGTYIIRASRKGCPTPKDNERLVTLTPENPRKTIEFSFGCKGPSPETGKTYGILKKADEFHQVGVRENEVLELIQSEKIDLTPREAITMFENINFIYKEFNIIDASQLEMPPRFKKKPQNLNIPEEKYLERIQLINFNALIKLARTPGIRNKNSVELLILFEEYILEFLKEEFSK